MGEFFCLSAFKILKKKTAIRDTCYLAFRRLSPWANHPRRLSKMPHRWFSCMTEPHFSERSASLESHLRPKIVASARPAPNPPCDYGLAPSNGFWSPRLSGDRPTPSSCFSLRLFALFFIMEVFAPKKLESSRNCHNNKKYPIQLFISAIKVVYVLALDDALRT